MHPASTRIILDERDDILTRSLRACEGPRIVGVVGLAHLDGIEQRWAAMNNLKMLSSPQPG